ncbi:hypothetical protein [Actinophytocola gossypii]|uniref:DUF4386 family protein n=1 Tax=Actinophytocola gossypii TaxID=2812003 RepID=A0ABT2J8C9_9PSEU|nr:hypothetical protein [Actinophytocola gossypii]MCT2583735.1 hypothetical protein [Actinophytocola gossypii]
MNKAFVVAPVALILGVLGMKFGWAPNDDLDWDVALPLWTAAHVAYVVGYLALGAVLLTVWVWARDAARSAGERVGVHVTGAVGAVGLVAVLGQMVIDLLVGFEAGSRAEMSAISDRYHDLPGFDAFFYGLVPALSLAGLSVLVLWLAARGRVDWWPALLFLAGTVGIGTQGTALIVAGGVAVGVALYVVGRARPGVLSVPAARVGVR